MLNSLTSKINEEMSDEFFLSRKKFSHFHGLPFNFCRSGRCISSQNDEEEHFNPHPHLLEVLFLLLLFAFVFFFFVCSREENQISKYNNNNNNNKRTPSRNDIQSAICITIV